MLLVLEPAEIEQRSGDECQGETYPGDDVRIHVLELHRYGRDERVRLFPVVL